MKKITFAIAAMAMFAFAACTNSTDTTSADSAAKAQAAIDSLAKLQPAPPVNDSAAVKVDSPAVKADVKAK